MKSKNRLNKYLKTKNTITILILTGLMSCNSGEKDPVAYYHELDLSAAPNTLSKKEQKNGWQLLFDGENTDGWRGYNMDGFPDWGKFDKGHIALQNHGSDVYFRNIKIKVLKPLEK